MKQLVFAVAVALLTLVPSHTSAHILERDGDIGAVIHVDPNDDPVAREESSFFFEFKDRSGKFQPSLCQCQVSIEQGGESIYSQLLFRNNSNPSLVSASYTYTFPQTGIYQVKITGAPVTPDVFQAFTLSYDIRVARESGQASTRDLSTVITYGLLGTLAVLFVGFSVYKLSKRKI